MKRTGRATIKDVAVMAGTTDMTVSRVVNGSGAVSPAMRQRVESAIEALGYVPNRLARGLRSNRTRTLALLVTDVTNPFFTTVARGVEDAASDRDHLVLLGNTDESETEELRYLDMLTQQSVDGVLLVPARTGLAASELAKKRGLPLVVLDRRVPMADVGVVRCDCAAGAAETARHLYGLGHRRFAVFTGPEGVPTWDDRVAGVLSALAGSDAAVNVEHGRPSVDFGREGATRAMKAATPPTALVALNNFIAVGVLQALDDLGLRVPEDVAVTGFDDFPLALVDRPILTVVSQPAYEMGRRGVEVLLERLENPDAAPQETLLPTELIVRKSSGAL